jgi:hypothetical protein
MRVEHAVPVEEGFGVGFQKAGGEALANKAALTVAAVGVEAVADDPAAVAELVGDDGNQARRHLGEVDVGVADRRGDRLGDLADVYDSHGRAFGLAAACSRFGSCRQGRLRSAASDDYIPATERDRTMAFCFHRPTAIAGACVVALAGCAAPVNRIPDLAQVTFACPDGLDTEIERGDGSHYQTHWLGSVPGDANSCRSQNGKGDGI